MSWVSVEEARERFNSALGSVDDRGDFYAVARGNVVGHAVVGKCLIKPGGEFFAWFPFGGVEHRVEGKDFEVLMAEGVEWVPTSEAGQRRLVVASGDGEHTLSPALFAEHGTVLGKYSSKTGQGWYPWGEKETCVESGFQVAAYKYPPAKWISVQEARGKFKDALGSVDDRGDFYAVARGNVDGHGVVGKCGIKPTGEFYAWFPWGGKEHRVEGKDFEVLLANGVEWVPKSQIAGRQLVVANRDGEHVLSPALFAEHGTVLGKYSAKTGQGWYPWGEKETFVESGFQVAVFKYPAAKWISVQDARGKFREALGSVDDRGDFYAVARGYVAGGHAVVGKCGIKPTGEFYAWFPFAGVEYRVEGKDFEVLLADGVEWVPKSKIGGRQLVVANADGYHILSPALFAEHGTVLGKYSSKTGQGWYPWGEKEIQVENDFQVAVFKD